MQFSNTIFALAAAMAVSGDVIFKVSDFSAACIPHSVQCSYAFTVIQPGTMETTGVKCSAQVTGSGDGTLPAINDGTCAESSRTFDVVKQADGLVLTVSQPVTPASNETGSYTIPSSDLQISQTGATSQQSYTGPTSFSLLG